MIMFTLTVAEGTLLGLGILAALIVLIVGALHAFPRARHIVPAIVRCPLLGRTVAADLEWDEWTVRFVDVARCSVLGACASVTCNRRCIAADVSAPVTRIA
jgi:hypothetical protein